ncbi:MAG: intein-containing RctB family protein [Anaerolineae bacterium]|nr:intein-containing RctB family protein [Anaerolineae bacterium]
MIHRSAIKQLSPYLYEIPASYREDMRVPARIYADRELLAQIASDQSLEQLVNTATLPGIVKYALAMPDIHQGYGFSIGGVVATDPREGGVVSPGGVGYDINCLIGATEVLHDLGYHRRIDDMAEDWAQAKLHCQNLAAGHEDDTAVVAYQRQTPRRPLLHLVTDAGDEVIATSDHPFWTPDGMVELGELRPGDRVGRYPFIGAPYEAPGTRVLVDATDIRRVLETLGKGTAGNASGQILNQLQKRNLLPLRADAPQTPRLWRLLGYLFGDGSLHFEGGSGKGVVWFYGDAEDLEAIRSDVAAVGFTPSAIYRRQRRHRIQTTYGQYEFEREETSFKVVGSAFAVLMAALGAPVGAKAGQDYSVPEKLLVAPRWHQRLFLAAYFGAELTIPRAFDEQNYNFPMPVLSLNKRAGFVASGRHFLEQIAEMLDGFGVETRPVSQRAEQLNSDDVRSHRLRLMFSSRPESLVNLWGSIGFDYNRKRQRAGMLAVEYLKRKQRVTEQRREAEAQAVAMQAAGVAPQQIFAGLVGEHVNRRFLQRSLYEGRQGTPRVSSRFEGFAQFCQRATVGIEDSGMVWATVESIQPTDAAVLQARSYDGYVYDFTVKHSDHNFVADGFVVSNCGVRLLASELEEAEVRPYLSDLATALYHRVPSGVGKSGFLNVSLEELDTVLMTGARWALTKGMARQDDLGHTEENGSMPGADPSKVSQRAKQRGRSQIGTLGAGNHFAELDVVDKIYYDEAAEAMGLYEGQVVVQIHCGSRGFGHQVCTDYVQSFQRVLQKYSIVLPDRQLVCAPVDSPEGRDYLSAMISAANYAWCNRQVLAHQIRLAFEDVLAGRVADWDLRQVYDIAHNMAKLEMHDVDGRQLRVCVHRKGATRAFGPGNAALPEDYRAVGQPVLVPGSMGTASWVLVGTEGSMSQTFGSTCHGAGRTMSRSRAKKEVRGSDLKQRLEARGISVRAGSLAGLAEEAPVAYKDVDNVVDVVDGAGIARKVARLRPIGVVKG